ncbi:MAG: ankyrin repeat domain-containing protein [Rhodospirillales bacterium]|nr:ankyrin repeat domain-containing protein [Rhodospirillales bacterium]
MNMLCTRLAAMVVLFSALAAPAVAGSASPAAQNSSTCTALDQKFWTLHSPNTRALNELLLDAADNGCLELARRVLDAGAVAKAANQVGNSALTLAARAGEEEVAELLLERGAPIDHRNLAGATALLTGVIANRRKLVIFLLDRGADFTIADENGVTPLAAAAFNGDKRTLERLLERGAGPQTVDRTGKAPILYAAARGFPSIVERLLDEGVPVNARYGHDLTALAWAAGHANDAPVADGLATVTLLLDRGADQSLADDRGRTPLMIAAERGHAEIVSLLLSRGGDPAHRDREGKTARDLAANAAVAAALGRP